MTDIHGMSDREILVMVATKLEYVEQGIQSTNSQIEKHVEALRIVINDCNYVHCKREDTQEKTVIEIVDRVGKVENRQYWLAGAMAVVGITVGILKENILSLFFKK